MHTHETKDGILSLDQTEASMQTRRKIYSYQSSVNKEMSIKIQLSKQFPNAEDKTLFKGWSSITFFSDNPILSVTNYYLAFQ